MKASKDQGLQAGELRKRAEQQLKNVEPPQKMTPEEMCSIIHELRVHQVELSMQNNALQEAQLELEASRDRYADLYDFAPVGYLTLDRDGFILDANLTVARELSRERSVLIGKPFVTYIAPEDRDKFFLHERRVFQSEERQSCDIRLEQPNGANIRLESITSKDSLGNKVMRTSLIDITRQKKTANALKESEERLRLALDAGLMGMWDHNLVTDEIVWSPRLYELLGRDPHGQEISGGTFFEYIHPEDRPRVETHIEQWMESGEEFIDEFRIVRQDGAVCWFASAGRLFRDETGRPVRIIGINYDISEAKQHVEDLRLARQAAEQANQAKSTFLSNMSHEIRTPMNGILGMAELALKKTQEPYTKECLGYLKSSGLHLLDIINDVLDLARIESGKINLVGEKFSFDDFLQTTIEPFRPSFAARELDFKLDVDEAIPDRMIGDPMRLRQVLINLLGNARKFTKRGSVAVTVDLDKKASDHNRVKLLFTIRDTGIGIPFSQLDKIFNSFEQAHTSNLAEYEGTGLGLTISKNLVALMGGELWAESQEGLGSTFFFTVMLEVAAQDGTEAFELAEAGYSGRPLNILVAEDSKVNQIFIEALLTDAGHSVVMAVTGREALEKLAEGDFDLVLMDIRMPEMGGDMAIRAIRENPPQGVDPNITVIALTAYALETERNRFMECGFDAYLTKPVELDKLYEILQTTMLKP